MTEEAHEQRRVKLGNVHFDNQHPNQGDGELELLHGLRGSPKTINPKYFYDARGSQLFDLITRLPEYYPTRTENGILQRYRAEIARCCGVGCVLIEPGSGNSEKVRFLLESVRPQAYVPLDISADFLLRSAEQLGVEFPWLQIHAVCADFCLHLNLSPDLPRGRRVIFYPGSTIGNLEPQAAVAFLKRMHRWMESDGGAVIGVDLHKSTQILNAAYNDSAGITADFNRNILSHINPLLDAEFDPAAFQHRAFYNTKAQRIEMHLVSEQAQRVRVNGSAIDFVAGESIHTESSYKYTVDSFSRLAEQAGLVVRRSWLDNDALFSVHYLERLER
jgi:dimethylhistidine N-methyltransferase